MRPKITLLLLALVTLMPLGLAQTTHSEGSYLAYVGTYTGPDSQGIYAFRFDPRSGKVTSLGLVAETVNPSFLAIDPTRRHLYAVNEVSDFKGEKSGGVTAFAIDQKTGKLTFLNEVSSHGAGPCHVALDQTGKYVLVANYDSGSVAVFPVLPDGRLGQPSSVVQHTGHGPNPERQEGPHAHEIRLTRDNRFALAADLGLDELLVYHFDEAKGTLSANDPAFAKVAPGAGPRHFAFHPNANFVYVLDEMGGNITGFSYNSLKGTLNSLQTVSTLPSDYRGKNDSAEIAVHGSGNYLYASNRGPDTIAALAVDPAKGTLRMIESVPTQGKTPRNFVIDPTQNFLLVANQESNNIIVFRIDPKTGHLTATGQVLEVPSPVCITFLIVD